MDDADRAKILETRQRAQALQAQRDRAEAGDADGPVLIYGKKCCRDCLCPIPEERLKARPNAARCLECKARWEKKNDV